MRPLLSLLVTVLASACATTSVAHLAPDPVEFTALSKKYIALFDARDFAAVQALTAPAFNRVGRTRFSDRKQFFEGAAARARNGFPQVLSRTWANERLRTGGDTVVFTAYSTAEVVVNAQGKKNVAETMQTLVWAKEADGWRLLHWQQEDAGLEAERSNWNEVFRQSSGFNLKPNRFLMEVTRERTAGQALDIGVGQGRNAIYLASKGWAVTGVDIADEGVRQTLATAKENGLTVDAQVQDATTWDWGENKWDLVCLIYEGGRDYVEKAVRALKPGGILVLEYFHEDATRGSGAGGFKTDEVPTLFKALKTVRYEEVIDQADYGMRTEKLVRYVGQKP